jgi:hypothetical protein
MKISANSDKKTKPSYERTKYRHPVLEAVHATSGPAHIKIFIKAISSTYDAVALIKAKTGN